MRTLTPRPRDVTASSCVLRHIAARLTARAASVMSTKIRLNLIAWPAFCISNPSTIVGENAGPAVYRTQERYSPVGAGPAVIFREAAETILHVPPGDAVKGTQLPVAEIAGELFKVQFFGARRPVGITRHVIGEGLLEKRHAAHLGALARRVGATGDLAQGLMGETPRLLG